MSLFLITVKGDSEDRFPVLSHECDLEKKEIVTLVFTSRHSAEDYIAMAGWTSEYCVEQVEPTELLKRLISAKELGVTHVTIEPKGEDRLQGKIPNLLDLANPYEAYADVLQYLQEQLSVSR